MQGDHPEISSALTASPFAAKAAAKWFTPSLACMAWALCVIGFPPAASMQIPLVKPPIPHRGLPDQSRR